MSDSVWIAFNGREIWPMQHEGDYAEGDSLLQITADGGNRWSIRRVRNESDQSGEATGNGLSFKQYQVRAFTSAFYPGFGRGGHPVALAYCIGKLNGEAGEASEAFWKHQRDMEGTDLKTLDGEPRRLVLDELGDALWYIAALCTELSIDLEQLAQWNLEKLSERMRHGKEGWSEARKAQMLEPRQGD